MISDNALTSAEELKEPEEVLASLEHKGTTWKFIPKKAPWFGGFLGTFDWDNQGCHQEDVWESPCKPGSTADDSC